jgi:hypothetical protein
VDIGSREENASKQKSRASVLIHQNRSSRANIALPEPEKALAIFAVPS